MSRRFAVLASVVGLSGCPVDVDLSGKRCPCVSGFVCDAQTNQCVPSEGAPFTFVDDEFVGEFDQGEFLGTAWVGDRVTLAEGETSGEYVSRRFSGGVAEWEALSFVASAPYGKELPNDGGQETGYEEYAVDMRDAVLLLHLDTASTAPDQARVIDHSGRGNNLRVVGAPGIAPVEGRIGRAARFERQSYLSRTVTSTSDFQFGEGDFAVALWVRTPAPFTENTELFVGVDPGPILLPRVWLGMRTSTQEMCPAGPSGARAGAALVGPTEPGSPIGRFCGMTAIDDGRWHHLALTKTGHASASVNLYVDGQVESSATVEYPEPIRFLTDVRFGVGAYGDGRFVTNADLDEVVVFRRSLSADEVRALYVRGALRLSFQVRECTTDGCSAFVGPGPDTSTFYVDPAQALMPGRPIVLDGPLRAPEFQYRFVFESMTEREAPSLRAVTVEARP